VTFSVWFEGIDELNTVTADVQRSINRVGKDGSMVVRRSAAAVEALGKQFCPVDTSFLKNSITTSFSGDGRFGAMEAEIGPEAEYGGYVEWGTRRMAPHAYMGPALDRVAPGFVAAVAALGDIDARGMRGGGRGRS
jgi:HK97 gp10 family phage protein